MKITNNLVLVAIQHNNNEVAVIKDADALKNRVHAIAIYKDNGWHIEQCYISSSCNVIRNALSELNKKFENTNCDY